MNLGSLKTILRQSPGLNVGFVLPDGDDIPVDFHVTEVGHVVKTFIDCGGTVRRAETCLLQAWVADHDYDHRLSTEKLARILDLSAKVISSDELEVEVEYQPCCVAQYGLGDAVTSDGPQRVQLAHKRTDCLAREACGLTPVNAGCGCAPGQNGGCG